LKGSIPAEGLLDIERFQVKMSLQVKPRETSLSDWRIQQWKKCFARQDHWLDQLPAARLLERSDLAELVASTLKHFDGIRYRLIAWVIMPSHIHWLFDPLQSWMDSTGANRSTARERIVHSINRYSAKKCNELLGRSGQFWQHETFDHWVRSENELYRIIEYIHRNPVVAGLVACPEDFRFSSAHQQDV
jgi:type I restriction enzyme R subunit